MCIRDSRIAVQRGMYLFVPEFFCNKLRRHPPVDQIGPAGPPERMRRQPDMGQARLPLPDRPQDPLDLSLIHI